MTMEQYEIAELLDCIHNFVIAIIREEQDPHVANALACIKARDFLGDCIKELVKES